MPYVRRGLTRGGLPKEFPFFFYSVANNSIRNGVDCFFPSLLACLCFSLALLSEVQGVKSINERTDPTW